MITFEYTDTYGGEANYCWVKRYCLKGDNELNNNLTDNQQLVRLAKKLFGLTGVKCRKDDYGGDMVLYPHGCCTVVFISYADDTGYDFGTEIDCKGNKVSK